MFGSGNGCTLHTIFSPGLYLAPRPPCTVHGGLSCLECQLLDILVFLLQHCGLGVLVVQQGAQLLRLDLLQQLPQNDLDVRVLVSDFYFQGILYFLISHF